MTYQIIIQVLFILAAAVVTGEVFEHFRLPAVPGQLLSGIVLGPTVFGVISTNDQIQAVSSVALFFVVFLIGFEINTDVLRKHLRGGIIISLSSFVIPLFGVFVIAIFLFPFGTASDLVAALAITVPSISIISVLVLQYRLLEKESGGIILSSVAVADIVAFIALVSVSSSILNTISVIGDTVIFLAVFAAVDILLNYRPGAFRRLLERASGSVRTQDISYAAIILVGLGVAAYFQAIGLSYILGAFFAGLIMRESLIGGKAFQEVSLTFTRMSRAFFIPIFFGAAGLQADLSASGYYLIPNLGIIIAATLVLSLGITFYASGSILRLSQTDAKQVSVILGGRGAVGIAVATVALGSGIINGLAYSLIIVATLVISLIVPLLLGRKAPEPPLPSQDSGLPS
ncbi:MAG: cation:proton antiporter [Thaumarchaeota archaeon]|nr:cation:proton antiporter [Nitrososphaerota archaeon]